MSNIKNLPNKKSNSSIRRLFGSGCAVVCLALLGFAIMRSPVNTFNPLCTYTANAEVSADVIIDGIQFSSSSVFQNSHSRRWISGINSGGCTQSFGNAIAYLLPNDRVLLIPTRLCKKAIEALNKDGIADVLSLCVGRKVHQNWAVLFDSASRPSMWRNLTNGHEFKLNRMVAISSSENPSDNIAEVAPNLLKSELERGDVLWQQSVERILPYGRRAKHKLQGKPFEFKVIHKVFSL